MCRVQTQASGMLQSDQWDRGRKTLQKTLQMLMYPEKTGRSTGTTPHRKARG